MKRKSDEIFNKIFYVTREGDYSQYEAILICLPPQMVQMVSQSVHIVAHSPAMAFRL